MASKSNSETRIAFPCFWYISVQRRVKLQQGTFVCCQVVKTDFYRPYLGTFKQWNFANNNYQCVTTRYWKHKFASRNEKQGHWLPRAHTWVALVLSVHHIPC